MTKFFLICTFCLLTATFTRGQKIDSIFFHLYTDSLKKGTNNYINVDGKSSDGRWIPLTSNELRFTTSGGRFENNDLVLPPNFDQQKVTVIAILKADTAIRKERTIYIKTLPDPELPKTAAEVMQSGNPRQKRKPGK